MPHCGDDKGGKVESASEFLRVLQHEKALGTAHRPLRLRLAQAGRSAAQLADEVLLPQRVQGSESVCGGIDYRIVCLAGSPALPLKELIALPAELQFVTDRGQLRRVCGIVTEARAGDADGGLAVYELVLRDVFAVMEKRTNSRIFRYLNELEIAQVLCDEWRHANTVLASAFELELDPLFDMRQFPPREQTMQYNESDAAFLRRLLKRRGVAWYFRPGRSQGTAVDPLHDRTPAHTLVLFSDANKLPQNSAGSVRYHRDGAAGGRDTIHAWTAARRLRPGVTTRHSWDYKNPAGAQFMTASSRGTADQGPNGNQLAATLDDYLVEMPHAGNDVEDHWRLGQVRMSRHAFESKCFHGEGSVRDFCAGQYFTLEAHPEIDTHPAPERDFVITELHVAADNNLPRELELQAGRLLGAAWPQLDVARAGDAGVRVRVRFTAVRRGIPIVPDYDPRGDLPHPELLSALVVGPAGEDVHCDALGRVKIRFPGMRVADHRHAHGAGSSGTPADSAWVRVASNWAGNGQGSQRQSGFLGLPRVGSEVLVAFLGGDPDRPIVLAQLYNQRSAPPAFSGVGDLPGNRYLSGTRSREVKGMRGNQLRFDDTSSQISAQLASDHGASELNLGWLAQPRANGGATPRGEGAELRSELSVAVRGARGVLISAEAGRGGDPAQLERAGLVGLAQVMQGILDEVGKLAAVHTEDEPAQQRLAALADKLQHWHDGSNVAQPGGATGGAPIVAASAPAGMLLASDDNLALGATSKIDLISAGDAEVSTGRNIFLRAARAVSLFAHELGLKLVAGRGDIVVQTHLGNIQIKSAGRISLVAAERIELEAPAVKIIAPGAESDWMEGTITHRSSGRQVHKAAEHDHLGPGDAVPEGLQLPTSHLHTDEYAVLRHKQTSSPVCNQRYRVTLANGKTVTGRTDDQGRTSLLIGEMIGDVKVDYLPDQPSR